MVIPMMNHSVIGNFPLSNLQQLTDSTYRIPEAITPKTEQNYFDKQEFKIAAFAPLKFPCKQDQIMNALTDNNELYQQEV